MKIKSVKQEELENMSYDDIAYVILKEHGKKMKITNLFKSICDILGLSDKEYEAKIADFFTMIITEKRFIQLDNGYCDLRDNHTKQIVINEDELEDEDEDIILDDNNEEDENEDDEESNYYDDLKDNDDDTEDDDLKDLVIIDDEDSEENIM